MALAIVLIAGVAILPDIRNNVILSGSADETYEQVEETATSPEDEDSTGIDEDVLLTLNVPLGDVNLDGEVTAEDARLALRMAVDMEPYFTMNPYEEYDFIVNGEYTHGIDFTNVEKWRYCAGVRADITDSLGSYYHPDYEVTAADARFILRTAVGLEELHYYKDECEEYLSIQEEEHSSWLEEVKKKEEEDHQKFLEEWASKAQEEASYIAEVEASEKASREAEEASRKA